MLALTFGISSLVFSVLAIFVPFLGVFIAGLSGILAWMSVGRAAFLGLAAVIINVFNIFLISPTFMLLMALEASQRTVEQSEILNLWIIVLAIQGIAVFLFVFNAILRFFLTYYANSQKSQQTISDPGEQSDPLPEDGAREKKDSDKRNRSPILAISFLSVLVFAGWVGFSFYFDGSEHFPLSRLFEGVIKKSGFTKDTTSAGSQPNVNPSQNGQKVTHHPELHDELERTSVEIVNNEVFIPITIIHNSKQLETSLHVNTNFSQSILPARVGDYLKADLLSVKSVQTIDGGEIILEKRKVDLFRVGPHIEHDFLVVTQKGSRGVTRGILGQDFLLKHPYSIDYENHVIIWQ